MGDRSWGSVRMLVVLFLAAGFMFVSGMIFERDALWATVEILQSEASPLWWVPSPFLVLLSFLFTWQSLRYLVAPIAAVVGALIWGARYVQDIYELKSYSLAWRYLLASLFAMNYPRLVISEGKRKLKPGEENLLDIIGGPGIVIVRPGNVVLFERLNNPSSVRAEGVHFVSRFETIKEISSLEDQHDVIEEMQALTKDGIIVTVREVHYRYRLWSSRRLSGPAGRSPNVPYPYSVQAVRNMAYNRAVRPTGWATWPETVKLMFESEIKNYIRGNKIDKVTAPRGTDLDPRGDIHQLYNRPGFRERFKGIGAELLWYDIGHFEVEDKQIEDQRVDTWGAEWRGDANVLLAYSDAIDKAYREQGRAEAQAEMLMAIVYALRDIKDSDDDLEKIKDVFLLRLAQLLDATGDRWVPSEGGS